MSCYLLWGTDLLHTNKKPTHCSDIPVERKRRNTYIICTSLDLLIQFVLVFVPEGWVTNQQDVQDHTCHTNTHIPNLCKHTVYKKMHVVSLVKSKRSIDKVYQLTTCPYVHWLSIWVLSQHLWRQIPWSSCKTCENANTWNEIWLYKKLFLQANLFKKWSE